MDDVTGEWQHERDSRITASNFGAVCNGQESYAPLTKQLLYNALRDTKQIRYGRQHKDDTRTEYEKKAESNSTFRCHVMLTGLHINLNVLYFCTMCSNVMA